MSARGRTKSSAEKVRAHRARLRAAGLRPVQMWVPDVRSPRFARGAHRQSRAVARSRYAADDQAFVDAISDWFDDAPKRVGRMGPHEGKAHTRGQGPLDEE